MNTLPVLNPSDYVVAPHVAAVDEFRMKNEDGSFVADINEQFIDRLIAHMNERERLTGDLAPLVIGHTDPNGEPEVTAPPVVGYARNWHKGELGQTGRKAAFFDAWVIKGEVDRVRRYPRRSCEVWTNRYEVDPISLLGATTPARDLGLMKLSRGGSLTYETNGEPIMADEKDEKKDEKEKDAGKPKSDPKEAGAAVHDKATLDQVVALLQQLIQMQGGGTGKPDLNLPDAKGGAAQDDQSGDISDAELEQLLSQAGGEGGADEGAKGAPADTDSRKGEKPVQNSATGSPGGLNTHVDGYVAPDVKHRLSRLESDLEAARTQLARRDVMDALSKIGSSKDVDPTDEALISDLIAMPEDMRLRSIERIGRLSRPKLNAAAPLLDQAASDPSQAGRKVMRDRTEVAEVMRMSRQNNRTYEQELVAQGYTVPGLSSAK